MAAWELGEKITNKDIPDIVVIDEFFNEVTQEEFRSASSAVNMIFQKLKNHRPNAAGTIHFRAKKPSDKFHQLLNVINF